MSSGHRVIAAVLLLVKMGITHGEERVFTNREGKTIQAEVSAVREGKVHLLTGGRTFAVPFTQLSNEDQAYVREWVTRNVDYRFTFQAEKKETKEKRFSEDSKNGNQTEQCEWQYWRYQVRITNRSGIDLKDLEVNYLVVMLETSERDHGAAPGAGEGAGKETLQTIEGSAKIPALGHSRSEVITTEEFELLQHKWQTGNQTGRNQNESVDRADLDGIWVRVFLKGRMIAEWQSPGKRIKEVEWKQPSAKEAG